MSGYVNTDGSSNTYTTLREHSDVVKEIITSSGLFKNRYKQVMSQVNSMNNIAEQFNSAIVSSIKHDIIDIMNQTTNWEKLKQNLQIDIKNKPKKLTYNFKPFKFDIDTLETIPDDLLVNMNIVISDIHIDENNNAISKEDKKNIRLYNEYKNSFIHEMDSFLETIKCCEDKAVSCRNNNVNIMKHNIEELYKIHSVYANNILHKNKNNFNNIVYTNTEGKTIEIPLEKSQNKFIVNAITKMLEI